MAVIYLWVVVDAIDISAAEDELQLHMFAVYFDSSAQIVSKDSMIIANW